tara:strand:- start:50 stop:433 length:384 start_codon:yes stop_codon:yes gene_type:complete
MRLENKLPFLPLYTKDMMTIMHSFRGTTRGVLFTLICETWNRRCVWITIEEARSMAQSSKVTNRQFDTVLKELKRFVAGNVFKFTALEELMEEAKTKSQKNSANAKLRWAKDKKTDMRTQSNTETDS